MLALAAQAMQDQTSALESYRNEGVLVDGRRVVSVDLDVERLIHSSYANANSVSPEIELVAGGGEGGASIRATLDEINKLTETVKKAKDPAFALAQDVNALGENMDRLSAPIGT